MSESDYYGISYYGQYSAADFPDAENERPYDIDNTSYTNAVTNAVTKHFLELKEKNGEVISLELIWKKRFRDFLNSKNSKILEFLTSKMKLHPVLGKSEYFFQVFGKKNVDHYHKSISEIAFDLSGSATGKEEINALCLSKELPSIDKYIEQTQMLLDEYKIVSDLILKKELELNLKLEMLETVNTSVRGLTKLKNNESYKSMMSGIETYMETVFNDCSIEENYNDLIDAYRKFIILREVLQVVRKREQKEGEPLCTICFNDSISYAFVPCGHTFCQACVKKQSLACSICRSSIKERLKLYLS